jgi:type II secretory pathway pseudopilin PulG
MKYLRGMTLTEVMVSLALFIVVMVVVTTFEVNVLANQKVVSGSMQVTQDAEVLLKTITKEIRSMTTSANGTYPLILAATNTMRFFSDSNNDGTIDQITYSLIGNKLYKAVIKPTGFPAVYSPANQSTTTLVNNVRNSATTTLFLYFDENYNGVSAPLPFPVSVNLVRFIQVVLNLDVDPNRSPLPVLYSASIQLRNLKTNL